MSQFNAKLYQSAQLRQEMRINPRLYQAMELLYMPLLDLEQHLKEQLAENPFLEMGEADEQKEVELKEDTSEEKQAIIDLSRTYGIVTDYTAMLVVRDEVFRQRGIDRTNKRRLETEEQARQKRAQAPVQSGRVDTRKPLYSGNQSNYRRSSGGGWCGASLPAWVCAWRRPSCSSQLSP